MQVTKWWSGTVARCKARVTRRCTTSSPSPSKSLRWSWLWRDYYRTDEAESAIPPRPPPLKKVIDYFSISFFIHLFANNFHSFDINTIFEINIQSFVNSLTNTGYVVWNLHDKVIFSLYPLFIIPPSTLEHTSQPLLLCYHYILGYLQSTKRIIIWNLVLNTIHKITLGSMDSQDFLSEILERRLGQGWWIKAGHQHWSHVLNKNRCMWTR